MAGKHLNAIALWSRLAVLGVFALIVSLLLQTSNFTTAQAALADNCATGSTQNSLSVKPTHGKVFYIDSGQGQNVDASYVGYNVVATGASAANTNLFMELSGFSGGVVSLSNPADSVQPLGDLSANAATKTGFFFLKANKSSTTAQSHVVRIWKGNPKLAGATEVYSCTYTFAKVAETIKAAANKVFAVSSSTTANVVGGDLKITTQGFPGTIGAGSVVDGKMVWISPAARSAWPSSALRLTSTKLTFSDSSGVTKGSNRACAAVPQPTANNVTNTMWVVENKLQVKVGDTILRTQKTKDSAGTPTAYTVTATDFDNFACYFTEYTFKILSPAAAPIVPIAQISSGTQIKHTDLSALPAGSSFDTTAAAVSVNITKTVQAAVSVTAGIPTFTYEVNAANSASAVALDEIVDSPDSDLEYVAGSARWNGVTVADPKRDLTDATKLVFTGPFTAAAGTTGSPVTTKLTYQMRAATCSTGGYNLINSATARIGSLTIGSGATTYSQTTVASNSCTTATLTNANVTTANVTLAPEVQTNPATSITSTSATLNGTVDPNGVANQSVFFEWGTSPTLASFTSVELAAKTTNASSPYAVSQSLTSGLSVGTTYYFRIRVGSSYGSILSFVLVETPSNPVAVTLRPTNINDAANTATLVGTVDPNLYSNGTTAGALPKFAWATTTAGNTTCSGVTLSNFTVPTTVTGLDANDNPITGPMDPLTGSFATEVTMDVSNLSAGQYCYKIFAFDASGASQLSDGGFVYFEMRTVLQQYIDFPTESIPTVGSTDTLAAVSKKSSDNSATNLVITYTNNTPDICSLTESGGVYTVTALKGGICSITASQAGNAEFYEATPVTMTMVIAKQDQVIQFANMSKVYGDANFSGAAVSKKSSDTTVATGLPIQYSAKVGACETSVATISAAGLIEINGVGNCVFVARQSGDDSWNAATDVEATLTVTAKGLTVTLTAQNKEYDDSTSATLNQPGLVGVLSRDTGNVTLTGTVSGAFASKNAGTGINVNLTGSYTLSGSRSGNYTLTQPSTPTANINAKPLTVTVAAQNKEYDGTTGATLGLGTLNGVLSGDDVSLDASGVSNPVFNDPNVANSILVTFTGSYALSGNDAANYSVTNPSNIRANITTKTLTITGLTGTSKNYDGNTNASYTGGSLSGVVAGDSGLVTINGNALPSASFVSPNASASPITINFNGNFSITGTKSGNYSLTQPAAISALINKANQTITFPALNDGYPSDTRHPVATSDSTLAVTISVSGDCTYDAVTEVITLGTPANYPGSCIVTASQSGNTNFNAATNVVRTFAVLQAPVNRLSQTITFANITKTYGDPTFDAGASSSSGLAITYERLLVDCPVTVAQIVNNEIQVNGAGSCQLIAKQAGNANYLAATDVTAILTVNPAPLTITNIVVSNKPYDGNDSATYSGQTLSGRVNGDGVNEVSISNTPAANFNNANAGNNKSVTIGTFTLAGTKVGNYSLTQPGPFTANITKVNQTITLGQQSSLTVPGTRNLTPSANSNLTVNLVSLTPSICTVSGTTVTAVAAGTCQIRASQPGDNNYNAATDVDRDIVINAAAVNNNGGNNNNNGGNNGNNNPVVQPTPTPSPTAASPTPTPSRPVVRPTPRPSVTANAPVALPTPENTTSPAPRVTPKPQQSATPAPTATPDAPLVKNITGLLNQLSKIVENVVAPTSAPQRNNSTAAPAPSQSPAAPANNAADKVTKVQIPETQTTVVTTEKVDGTKDVLSAATRTVAAVAAEKISGFAPSAGIRIEVIGSRIAGQFVVTPGQAADPVAIAAAIEESTARQRTNFASIDKVVQTTPPASTQIFSTEIEQPEIELFAASGLAKPISLKDLNVAESAKWIKVDASADTYLPGTLVYLTVTTQPIIFGEAVVDKFGKAQLSGSLPIDLLEAGGHSIRLVGIRSLEGVSTDANGEIVLSDEAVNEIQKFDDGTQATVIISGASQSGGSQTVIREIPLEREVAWWTVWFAFIVGLLTLVARLIRRPVGNVRRTVLLVTAFASALPAAIIGWVSVTYEIWIGVAIAAAFGVLNLLMGRDKKRKAK